MISIPSVPSLGPTSVILIMVIAVIVLLGSIVWAIVRSIFGSGNESTDTIGSLN